MNTKILLVSFSLILAGCEGGSQTSRPGPFVKPGLVMVPADQFGLYEHPNGSSSSVMAQPNFSALDARSVQTDATVSAIQFNRYPDPVFPDKLMHEAHIVYRRDNAPRWKLQPSQGDQQILIGPQITDGRGEIKPLVSPELDAYLQQQHETHRQEQAVLAKVTETMRQLSDQQQRFAEQLAKQARPAGDPAPPPQPLSAQEHSTGGESSSMTTP